MKSIIVNDILSLLNKKKLLLIIYFICVLFVIFYIKNFSVNDNIDVFRMINQLEFYKDSNIILKIFMVFNLVFYLYLGIYILLKDSYNSYGNIFSRISKLKWLVIKLISIIIITVVFKIIVVIFSSFVYDVEFDLYNILFVINTQVIFLGLYLLWIRLKNYQRVILSFILILFVKNDLNMITSSFYDNYIILIILIVSVILYIIIGKLNIKILLERNG